MVSAFRERCGAALVVAALGLPGCSDENSPPVPEAPGTFLLDHTWDYTATELVTDGAESVPFPSSDVLAGSRVRFGADGRVLVLPPGFDEVQDFGARYTVTSDRVLRLQLARSLWFPYEYHFDGASGVLLLNPEPVAADVVIGFVSDVLTATVARGDVDARAATFSDELYRDARVSGAVEDFLGELVHGPASSAQAPEPESVAASLYAVLAPSGVFEPGVDEDAVLAELTPRVDAWRAATRGRLTNRVVSDLLDSDVLDATLTLERAERVLRFTLYRQVLTTAPNLRAVERLELDLLTAD
jgi:hypothetical protein